MLFCVLCLPGDQSHPVAQPTINPLACCICWAGLLGRTVFPPWNEGPNSGSYSIICIPEVAGISPISLDSSLLFIQPSISHNVLCICGSAGKESTCNAGLNPGLWVRSLGWKIPWRTERLPTPVFWPREFHGLYRPWGHKELEMTEKLSLSLCI